MPNNEGDVSMPDFYSRHNNQQCLETSVCYVAHRIAKPGGKWRRGRKHLADCPHGMALHVKQKLKH